MPSPTILQPNAKPNTRLHYLDGLRGMLALLVFVFHLLGSNIPLIKKYFWQTAESTLYASPLGALFAGWQFVLGFFILSGIALTLPLLKTTKRFNWLAYYPSRLLRLYLPAVASIGVAVLILITVGRALTGQDNNWLVTQVVHPIRLTDLQYAFALQINDQGAELNAPLWSLRWEIVFSLLLPLLFIALKQANTRFSFGWLLLVLTGIVALATYTKTGPVLYLAMFPIGMLWALHIEKIHKLAAACAKLVGRNLLGYGTAILSIMIFWFSAYRFQGLYGPSYNPMFVFQVLAALAGTLLLIFAASTGNPLQTFLTSRMMQFAGKISFSLYLTHLPVITFFQYVIPPTMWYLNLILGVPAVFIVAWAFWFLIERPIHLGSRRLHGLIARRTDASWSRFVIKAMFVLNSPIGNNKKAAVKQ